jgi:uncharacterized protein (DUF2237 family)
VFGCESQLTGFYRHNEPSCCQSGGCAAELTAG